MKGLFIPGITAEMFRNGCLESIEALMAEGEIYDIEYSPWIPVSERLPDKYTYTLWCASSGYVRSDYFNGEFWEDAKKYCYEIVAWMPLPEPPYGAEREGAY